MGTFLLTVLILRSTFIACIQNLTGAGASGDSDSDADMGGYVPSFKNAASRRYVYMKLIISPYRLIDFESHQNKVLKLKCLKRLCVEFRRHDWVPESNY